MAIPSSSPTALTQERLRELLDYDPETGVFTWLVNQTSMARAGDVAGGAHWSGYHRVSINRRRYLTHRLAFLYMTGAFPAGHVDHRDGDKGNNRWVNLRGVCRSVNLQNRRGPQSNNRCGYLGVCKHKSSGRWRASIVLNRRHIHVGLYDTPEEAHKAYLKAKRELHEGCTI